MAKSYSSKNYDVLLKVLLVGDTKSRKTDLLHKFSGSGGGEDSIVGLDYHLKDIVYKGQKVKLQIWDTAGQERFRSVTSSYYRGSQGCLLVFNTKSMLSFTGLSYWLEEIKTNAPESFETILVALSCGSSEDEVDLGLTRQYAHEHSLTLVSVDIDNLQQVQSAFDSVVDKIMCRSARKRSNEEGIRVDSGRRGSPGCSC